MSTAVSTQGDRLIKVDAPALGHIPAFDGFRGLFVLGVVFYHADVTPFLGGMPLVIDWFFVSSGFLITTLMLDERNRKGAVSLRNFYTRRVLRLFPAMYTFLATFTVLALLVTLFASDTSEFNNWWVDVVAGATYVYNFVAAADPEAVTGAIGHIWSLTVEEQFYFLWPLLLVAVLKRATRRADARLIVGSIIFVAIFFFLRAHFQYIVVGTGDLPEFSDAADPTWQGFLYRFASMRPDMIVYGCLMAFVARAIPRPIPLAFRRFLAVAGPICWAWFFIVMFLGNDDIPGFELWGGPAYQVALLAIGPAVLDTFFRPETRFTRAFTWKPISWLGLRTYGIYLWHVLPILVFLPAINDANGVRKLILGLIASSLGILLGLGSYRFIERRFLRMKERFSDLPPAAKQAALDLSTSSQEKLDEEPKATSDPSSERAAGQLATPAPDDSPHGLVEEPEGNR